MNTIPPPPGLHHLQNLTILAHLLGLDISQNALYSTWPASTQLSIIRGSLKFKIRHHIFDEGIAERINIALLNLEAGELLALLSDSAAFDARIVALRDRYDTEQSQQQQDNRTPRNPIPFSANQSQLGQSSANDPNNLANSASPGHTKTPTETPEQRNSDTPFTRANNLLFGLGSVAVDGVGGILRTASGTALTFGQTALDDVTGWNNPTSPVHRTRSERVLGSPRLGGAGAGEEWEMTDAGELDLNLGRERVPRTQPSYQPSRPGFEEDLAEAMNGRM